MGGMEGEDVETGLEIWAKEPERQLWAMGNEGQVFCLFELGEECGWSKLFEREE